MNPVTLGFIQFVLLLAGVGACIAVLIILLLAMIQAAPASSSRSWASTLGIIIASFVAYERDAQDPKGLKAYYVPNVVYEYIAGGERQNARRIHFGAPSRMVHKSAAENKLANYPVGAQVNVFYNPDKPDDAVLERQAPEARRFGLVAVGVLASGLVACALAFLLPGWVS